MIFYKHLEEKIREDAIQTGDKFIPNLSSTELRELIGTIYDEILSEQAYEDYNEVRPDKERYCQILCEAFLNVIESLCDAEDRFELPMFLWKFSKSIIVMHEKETNEIRFAHFRLYSEDGIDIIISTSFNGIRGYVGEKRVCFIEYGSKTAAIFHQQALNLWQKTKHLKNKRTIDVGNGQSIAYLKT